MLIDTYTTGDVAKLFHINSQTVRRYTAEFSAYFSIEAQPGSRRTRVFNNDDLEVLALIAEMKEHNKPYSDIHTALQNGQRGVPPNPEVLLASSKPSQQLSLQVETLREQLALATIEVQSAKAKTAQLEFVNEQLQERTQKAEHRVQELIDKLIDLQREIGKMEGKLETLQDKQMP